MGHYDEIYEKEEEKRLIELNNRLAAQDAERKANLCRIINGYNREDAKFIEEITDNLESYKGFFSILERSRK